MIKGELMQNRLQMNETEQMLQALNSSKDSSQTDLSALTEQLMHSRKELEATRSELLNVTAKAIRLDSVLADVDRLKEEVRTKTDQLLSSH